MYFDVANLTGRLNHNHWVPVLRQMAEAISADGTLAPDCDYQQLSEGREIRVDAQEARL